MQATDCLVSLGSPTYSHLNGDSQSFLEKNTNKINFGTEIYATKEMSGNAALKATSFRRHLGVRDSRRRQKFRLLETTAFCIFASTFPLDFFLAVLIFKIWRSFDQLHKLFFYCQYIVPQCILNRAGSTPNSIVYTYQLIVISLFLMEGYLISNMVIFGFFGASIFASILFSLYCYGNVSKCLVVLSLIKRIWHHRREQRWNFSLCLI